MDFLLRPIGYVVTSMGSGQASKLDGSFPYTKTDREVFSCNVAYVECINFLPSVGDLFTHILPALIL